VQAGRDDANGSVPGRVHQEVPDSRYRLNQEAGQLYTSARRSAGACDEGFSDDIDALIDKQSIVSGVPWSRRRAGVWRGPGPP